MAIQNWRNTLSQPPEESSPARSGRGVAGSLPSPTVVGQMIGTSDVGGAFKVSASPNVSADVQRAFIQRIVYRQWDFRNPLAAGERAVYLHQISKSESLFGWLYSEPVESSTAVPYFICCYLAEPLNATQLENILLWLQVGPADPNHSHTPATVADLHAPDLWNHRPARPGVAVPEALVLQSLDKLERGELIDLFVPVSQLESLSAVPTPVLPVFPTETVKPSGPPRRPRRAPAFSGVGLLVGVLVGGGVAIGLATLLLLDPGASRSVSKSTAAQDRSTSATDLPAPAPVSPPTLDAAPATQVPTRPSVAKPLPTRPTAPPKDRPAETRPSGAAGTARPQPEVSAIPGLPTGTSLSEVEAIWGTARVRKGYWPNTEAATYDFAPNRITVGYVFDRDSKQVRQSEVAFAQSIEPTVMRQTVSQILGAEANPTIMQGLKRVYQRQTSRYAFRTDTRKGVIERNAQDRIYIGVWESDLH